MLGRFVMNTQVKHLMLLFLSTLYAAHMGAFGWGAFDEVFKEMEESIRHMRESMSKMGTAKDAISVDTSSDDAHVIIKLKGITIARENIQLDINDRTHTLKLSAQDKTTQLFLAVKGNRVYLESVHTRQEQPAQEKVQDEQENQKSKQEARYVSYGSSSFSDFLPEYVDLSATEKIQADYDEDAHELTLILPKLIQTKKIAINSRSTK